MALKIIQPNEVVKRNNIVALIAGLPGAGKTSLACMTSRPLLLDCDKIMVGQSSMGSSRAEFGETRRANIEKWDQLEDMDASDVADRDTVIVDTLGGSLNLLTEYIQRKNVKLKQSDGTLSIKGWTVLKDSYVKFLGKMIGYGKNVVLVAHAVEGKGAEEKGIRVDAQGGAKIEIFKVCDLMGLLFKENKKYIIDFDQTEIFHGKNPARFEPGIIPDPKVNRDFLQTFLQGTLDRLNQHQEQKVEAKTNVLDFRAKIEAADYKDLEVILEELRADGDDASKKIFGEVLKTKGIGIDKKHGLFLIKDYENVLKGKIAEGPAAVNAEWQAIKGSGPGKGLHIFPRVVRDAGYHRDSKSDVWLLPNQPAEKEDSDFGEEF